MICFQATNHQVQPCGMFIDPSIPYLAATPDGLVGDSAVVEVKCPFTGKDDHVVPGPLFPFVKEGEDGLYLNPMHPYYDQVQGQLFLTKRKLCYFVVFTSVHCKIINVAFDEEYVLLSLMPKLSKFYDEWFVPYVAKLL
jgi:hypothetical protein